MGPKQKIKVLLGLGLSLKKVYFFFFFELVKGKLFVRQDVGHKVKRVKMSFLTSIQVDTKTVFGFKY